MAALLATALTVAACGSDSSDSTSEGKTALTLYNAQHDFVAEMVSAFTKETGIKVNMRNGKDLEMANQIVQEGDRSPADVFLTENSPAMTLVDNKVGFAPIAGSTLDQVPARYRPANGRWVGFAARGTVLAYNKDDVRASDLPTSIIDLARPKWKGKVGYAPTGADFQAIVSAVLQLKGPSATKAWLEGLKANGVAFEGNSRVMKAVDDGQVAAGISYHYYWYQDQAEGGDNSSNTKLHFFGQQDPGAFVSVSGAGVLASSKLQEEAQQLVRFLTGKVGQQVLADDNTALEYTVASDVPANELLKPLAELDAPAVDPSTLNSQEVITLMQDAGIL